MQKHLIKQVFVAIWMWWLVERRKKMGNLCMKSIIETVFCVDFFEYMVWPFDHTNNTFLNEFCIIFSYNPQESTIPNSLVQTHSQYSLLGPLHRIIWNNKFSVSYSVISKNNSACVNIFPNFNCTISDCNFQCWIYFFFESELKFCSFKREKWTLVKLLQNKYH